MTADSNLLEDEAFSHTIAAKEGMSSIDNDTEKGTYVSSDMSSEEVSNENLVDFDGEDDPDNPINWSPRYKWAIVGLLSLMSTIV